MKQSDEPGRAILRQISAALGLPMDRFFTDPASMRPAVTADECLRLWSRIKTEAGRQQALEALQMIADHEGARLET